MLPEADSLRKRRTTVQEATRVISRYANTAACMRFVTLGNSASRLLPSRYSAHSRYRVSPAVPSDTGQVSSKGPEEERSGGKRDEEDSATKNERPKFFSRARLWYIGKLSGMRPLKLGQLKRNAGPDRQGGGGAARPTSMERRGDDRHRETLSFPSSVPPTRARLCTGAYLKRPPIRELGSRSVTRAGPSDRAASRIFLFLRNASFVSRRERRIPILSRIRPRSDSPNRCSGRRKRR